MSLFDRLVDAVRMPQPPGLLKGDINDPPGEALVQAAVLVAVTAQPDPAVILTVRRAEMRRHAGQVAFPGGRIDPGEDAVAAAVREAEEEIGMPPHRIRIAGQLDPYVTITGYHVSPVLAEVPPGLPLAPHEAEVEAIFEVPLEHLLNGANHLQRTVLVEGVERHYYQIPWKERNIWGATAAMIVNLSHRLRWP